MPNEELRPLEDLGYFPEPTLSIAEAVDFVPQKKYALQRWTHDFLIPTVLDGGRRRLHKWTIIGLREGKIIPPRVPRGSSGLDVKSLLKGTGPHVEGPVKKEAPPPRRRKNIYGFSNAEVHAYLDLLGEKMTEAEAKAAIIARRKR